MLRGRFFVIALGAALLPGTRASYSAASFGSGDLHRLRAVTDVRLSADGARVAYSVRHHDRSGLPYSVLVLRDLAEGLDVRIGSAADPRWSPDGSQIAWLANDRVVVADARGRSPHVVAPVVSTNHPLPESGAGLSWSPDGKSIAYVSATVGAAAPDANADPVVITRYLYKPVAGREPNDDRRLHVFVVDLVTGAVRQLTDGPHYDHSVAWSPLGDEILFVSNREPDADRVFNYDVFAVRPDSGVVRRITQTKSAEYDPVWSPDGKRIAFSGTTRDLTSSETTMEDTHVWVMNADGSDRREVGRAIDNRQGAPQWSRDGSALYFTVSERGSDHLVRLPVDGGEPETLVSGRGSIAGWSAGGANVVAYAFSRPEAPADLFLWAPGGGAAITSVNAEFLRERTVAPVTAFEFESDDGTPIEAFLTRPAAATKAPLIVIIHGGPHAQQGPAFNAKAQAYAARGWATLMVNYRGSVGYGQKLADGIFGDQNGKEAVDVLRGVDAALAANPWIDRERIGVEGVSYGGQLVDWLVTQTDRFKAAISIAGISNLVSFHHTAYYHDYLSVEFGAPPHSGALLDRLWERSPLRHARRVKTPTMLLHGENDNDVPIAESEQFYIALHEVGVETVLVRYPREGHGFRETKHVIDALDRSIAWYERHFTAR